MENKYIVKFKDFRSKKAFIELQRYFLSLDYKQEYFEKVEIDDSEQLRVCQFNEPLENPSIIYYSRNYEGQEKYDVIEFEKDFLLPKMKNLSNSSMQRFKKNIGVKGLFSDELLQGYALNTQNKINKIKDVIELNSYLSQEVTAVLLVEIDKLEDLIGKYVKNPLPELKEKIPIKWSRTDIIYFFHLLRRNGVIDNIREADLGRILDNGFKYFDNKEKKYCDIKNSKKHLNAFWNEGGRPENAASERLKEVFQNEDFFNV